MLITSVLASTPPARRPDVAMAVDRARVSANMAKWRKAARMVGRTAAGLDVWQKNAQERLRLRREALLKPPARRTEADVVLLETVLSRVKFVRELTMKTRMDLCKLTGYARHGAGETLFRQGDAGEFFYVVLSGSVDVFIRDPGGREHLVATLFNGDSFGELALMHEGNTRGATIVAKEDCEFLTLGREDYGAILRTQSEKSISEKVAHLRSTPMFRHVEHDTVQSMAYVLAARTYPRNALVFKQGEEVEDVYFIAEGAARLVREVENRETLRRAGVTRRGPGCLFGKTRGRGHSWDEPPTPPGLANEWLDANEDGEDRFAPDAAPESIDDATPLPGGSRRTSATVGANELAAASVAMADVSFGDSSDDEDGDFDDGASATSRSSRLSRESRMTEMESRFRGSFAAALSLGGGGDGTGGASSIKKPRPRSPSFAPSEKAAREGLGRLFLEVGSLARGDVFGDTVLTRRFAQPASVITTAPTRVYVMNKWDVLRRADAGTVEKFRRGGAKTLRACSVDDEALLEEFRVGQEWGRYRTSMVERTVEMHKELKALRR